MNHAAGTFEVSLSPQPHQEGTGDPSIGRLAISKQFQGDLTGSSNGEMLSAGTEIEESAAYVALERVRGTLEGRSGTFALHHTGVMTRGDGQLSIKVVPDSGTGQLAGISGEMDIDTANGGHRYSFNYSLPALG